ncbi:MAG: GNAT family N-acetyltransferase [Pseudomonadota bacterium]|nr:GNAT family N-acetyltransferase [Pseudomonadota bacterium]
MTVLIRSALAFDLSEIPALECAAAQRFLETAHPELASAPPSMTDAVLDLALREDRLLVAEQDGALCGFALLDQRGEEGWLREFNVPPAFGNRGVGRALLAFSCAWGRGRSCTRLTLTTFRTVPFNGPFYARFGFSFLEETSLPPHLMEALAAERAAGLRDRCAMALVL